MTNNAIENRYVNKKTGAVILSEIELAGAWELETPKKKVTKKNDTSDD